MASGAKRWRGVNGSRENGVGERKGGAGRKRRREVVAFLGWLACWEEGRFVVWLKKAGWGKVAANG